MIFRQIPYFAPLFKEQRQLHRVPTDCKILFHGIHGKLLNISQSGLAFFLSNSNLKQKIFLDISFFGGDIDAVPCFIVWEKLCRTGIQYGAKFIELSILQKQKLQHLIEYYAVLEQTKFLVIR